jgi:tetratricopeptide (TPR) repeat protein
MNSISHIKAFYSMSFLLLFFMVFSLMAQPQLTLPEASPEASITQIIGVSKIKISYHRPGVKERKIWDGLVPYGEVWRAGANENTTIYFSDPVKVEGQDLPAGKYGLHMIPNINEWIIIFSTVNTGWGSYGYSQQEDALRVTVKPETAPFEERLNYRFDNPTNDSVEVALYWEKLRVPFKVELDSYQAVLKNIRQELHGLAQFYWQPWNQAAMYCLQNNINHEEALQWVERSINMNENLTNLFVKSRLLSQMGNEEEAEKTLKQAWDMAMATSDENQLNQFGYRLLFAERIDDAIQIFKKNVELHPDSWNVYDSLGEGYANKGDTKNAIKYYSKALEMVENETQRTRIKEVLKNLQGK